MPESTTQPSRLCAISDPLLLAILPHSNESSSSRERRLDEEREARRVSDNIDAYIRQDSRDRESKRPDVKMLLLGQSESGKSTIIKRAKCNSTVCLAQRHSRLDATEFQLIHAPQSFHAERVAWRTVIYLNLVSSVRQYECTEYTSHNLSLSIFSPEYWKLLCKRENAPMIWTMEIAS